MIKINIIRWLNVLKSLLLVNSILFLSLAFTIFINYMVSHATYSGDFTVIVGAYESGIIKDYVATNFSLRFLHQLLYTLMTICFAFYIIVNIILVILDRHCIHTYKYLYIGKLLLHTAIFIMISIIIFSAPLVPLIDLNVQQLSPKNLLLCYDYTVNHQLLTLILNEKGIIIIALLATLFALCFSIFLLCIVKIMKRIFF